MITSIQPFYLQGETGFRRMMQQAPVAMAIVVGPEFIVYMTNRKQQELWQRTSGEIEGKPLFELFPEVAAQGFLDILRQVYRTGVAWKGSEMPTQFYRNGQLEQAWFDFIYEPLRNDLDAVEGIMVISTEVTEKVVARKKLEEATERLYYTVKLSPQVPWTTDASGNLEWVSEQWLDLTGEPPAALLQQGWQVVVHPDEVSMLSAEWQQSLRSGQPFQIEHRVLMHSGTFRWMRSRAYPQKTDVGQVLRWYGSTEDIHEQKEALLQIKQQEEKYRSLFNRMNQGFCIIEVIFDDAGVAVDYRFLECNPLFESQTGLSGAAGKTARELLPNLEPHWFQLYGEVATTGLPKTFVEGSEVMGRWFEVNAYKLGEEDSHKVAILFSDISERRRSEDALRQATRDQENTVAMLQSLLNNAPVGFAFTNKEHRFVHLNEQLASMNGVPVAEHIGRRVEEVIPNIGKEVAGYFKQVIQSKQPLLNMEIGGVTAKQPDETRHWLAGYYPVFAPGGQEVEYVGSVVTEITRQKRVEQRIAESERRYYEIYNRAPVSIWEEDFSAVKQKVMELNAQGVTDIAGYFSQHREALQELVGKIVVKGVNKAAVELHGGTEEELLQGLQHFFVDETLSAFVAELEIIANGGGHFEYETLVRSRMGNLINVLVRIDFPYDDDYSNIHVLLLDITERKQAELALRESEERFRNLADNAPVMVWITDQNGFCHYLNKQWYEYTGQTIEEGHGLGWTQAVHPDEREQAGAVFMEASKNHQPYRIEFRLRKWDGTYRWVIDSAVPRLDPAGNFLGFIGSVVDIHDQKLAQVQLQKLNSHLELSTNAAGVGTWSYDLRSGLLEWSDLHNEMWGYGNVGNQLSYEDWYRIILEQDREKAIAKVDAAARSGKDYLNEYRIQRVDNGLIRWMRSFGRFILDEQGKAAVLTGITIDITDAKNVEEALRESEERFRSLADNAPMWVWLSDEEGKITYANKEELAFFEATSVEELSGRSWESIIHHEDFTTVLERYNRAILEPATYSIEARLLNKNTQEYEWYHFRGVPRLEGGTMRGIIGTAINIHQQKLLTGQLEQMVKDRTRDLERSNEELRQFAHVASHDLKEPIRKILTFHNLLVDEYGAILPEKAIVFLGKIEKAASRSRDMIEGLLLSTSVQASSGQYHLVDLNQLMLVLQDDLELQMKKSGATVSFANLPVIEGIHQLLYHLFYNLMSNSLKFGKPQVPVLLHIAATLFEQDEREFARIIFKDNGIGFNQSFADQIFQPFIRLHSKDEFEGAGLGLSFCRQVAERHGGSIKAVGTEGSGAEFIVELPLRQIYPA